MNNAGLLPLLPRPLILPLIPLACRRASQEADLPACLLGLITRRARLLAC